MRWGFKSEAERIALAERGLLEIEDHEPLDPRLLAGAKEIGVVPISELGIEPVHLDRLQREDPAAFSAAAVIRDARTLIVVNNSHTVERQANSICHELSHVLLGHPPAPAFDERGARHLTKEMEDEADWLAGCLLVPGSGIEPTMHICDGNLKAAARHYGVSIELMRWRHNMTQPPTARAEVSST